ncbi:hypothetical protein RAH41_06535 [Gottfriedia acidiceleris]|uniref:hypothetical protein n=1 Tax=Gottfriedia acidiceleris TaxID=371036 RepID=UPI002F264AE3
MNIQFANLLGEYTFIERKNLFKNADVVLYHPGHFPELNEHIINLYKEESFKKIMIPSVFNDFLKEDEYIFHNDILVDLGIPENIIYPIRGEAESANDVIKNAMLQLTNEKNILLIGKTFFMYRFLLIASAFAKEDMILDVLPLEDNRSINKETWYLTDGGRKRVLNEYHKISQFIKQNSQIIF